MAKMKMELLKAYWPEEDVRVNEGTIFEVEAEDAVRLVEEGIAKRAPKEAEVTGSIADGKKAPAK